MVARPEVIPTDVEDPAVVGRRTPAVNGMEIVTGRARYTTDFYWPGMLVGQLLYTGYPHARIVRLDATRARRIPGVHAVMTHAEVPGENSYMLYDTDQPLLIRDVARYQGDAIAAVAAESEEAAAAALAAIDIEYQELPGLFDVMEAVQPHARQVWPDRSNIYHRLTVQRGDLEAGFAAAEIIIENTYQTQCMEQAFLEPEGAVASVDSDGTIVVHAGCQAPHRDRRQIARSLALPETKVRVIVPYVGGSFGGKDETHVQIHAALLAQVTGRPIRMIRTREESIRTHVKRHAITVRHRLGATKQGLITAMDVTAYGDGGPYANMTKQVMEVFTIHASGPYYVPNARIDAHSVLTNNPIAGAMRGFGMPQAHFATERQMDELARKIGLDPMEIRLKNAIETGKKMATGVTTLDASGMRNSLHAVAEMSGWRKRQRIERRPAPHLRRGWGLACMMQGYLLGPKVADNAFAGLEMNEDGSVMLRTGVVDYGQGSHTVLAQITAEALGVELGSVRVIGPDTDKTLESGSACASRVTFICGHAVLRAARVIHDQLLETAAELSSLPRGVLSLRLGVVHSDGMPLDLTVRQLAAAARAKSRPLSSVGYYSAEYPPKIFDERVFDNPCAYYTFGANVAQVLVDVETGQVTVEKLFLAQDAGRILNPDGAMGQAEGGVSMGFGYSVMEELIIEKGRTRNNSLESYLIPTVQDVPEIQAKYVESVDRYGPYGSRALSEGSVVPIAAAIANAVRDAVGVSMVRIPLTAERVLAAMNEQSARA